MTDAAVPSSPPRRIYAVDVGSTRTSRKRGGPAFAWVSMEPGAVKVDKGQTIEPLVEAIAADLGRGISVALGFEAPLFLPVPEDALKLSQGRECDKDRSCFAPAGGYVATLCLHQAAWILRKLKAVCVAHCRFTLDPASWPPQGEETLLFCWEAFVSGPTHASKDDEQPHLADAETAACWFAGKEGKLREEILDQSAEFLSLIGTAALWSGWTSDLEILRSAALVVKPTERHQGIRHNTGNRGR